MSTINFNQLFQSIESGVEGLAKTSLHDYLAQAKTDGTAIVDEMKEELQQWAAEVEEGTLTTDDVSFLVKEQAALSEMTALKEAGLAAVRIDEFRAGIINVVTGAVAGLVKV